MPNITLSIEEDLLKKGREYARRHHTSLNKLIRQLLHNTINSSSKSWLAACFKVMDRAGGDSAGKRWIREDLHRE